MTTGKTIALTRLTFVGKVMSLLLNMLSRLVITFLPRSKCLLISWLQDFSRPLYLHGSIGFSELGQKPCHQIQLIILHLLNSFLPVSVFTRDWMLDHGPPNYHEPELSFMHRVQYDPPNHQAECSAQCPSIDEWMKEMWLCVYSGILLYSTIKNIEFSLFAAT